MLGKAFRSVLIGLLILLLVSCSVYHPSSLEVTISPVDTSVVADYTPHGPIVILNNNFTGWPGSGTAEEPYTISGLNITSNGISIHVANTNLYYVIEDCFLYNYNTSVNFPTVVITDSNNSRIENCVIIDDDLGVNMGNSHNSNITGNTVVGSLDSYASPFVRITNNIVFMNSTCENVTEGIHLRNSCDNGFVFNNTIEQQNLESNVGISVQDSHNVTVLENKIRNINSLGLLFLTSNYSTVFNNTLQGCTSGVHIVHSNFTIFEGNEVFEGNYGVQFSNSNNCTIIGNGLHHNTMYGLDMESTNCSIYNNFIGFNNYPEQARDYVAGNMWDNGVSIGNYWSNYDGEGTHEIEYVGGVDHYPKTFIEPFVSVLPNFRIEYGDTGHEISWSAHGTVGVSYEVRRNGSLVLTGPLSGDLPDISLDGLETGLHKYTLIVYYMFLSARDTVSVIVEPSAAPTINLDAATGIHQQPIEVTCSLIDTSAISSAILSYTVDAIVWHNVSMSWNGTLLKWTGVIPAQVEGIVVGYKVYACDAVGNWAVSDPLVLTVAASPATILPTILILGIGVSALAIVGIVFALMKRR